MKSISRHRLWIAGQWCESQQKCEVNCPYTGEIVATVDQATAGQLEVALQSAMESFVQFRKSSRSLRSRLLSEMANGIEERRMELVQVIISEAGKPRSLANAEVSRAVIVFKLAAEESKRLVGEMIAVDIENSGIDFMPAVAYQVARGPVLAIAPFNFPLNLVAHKVAPALAVGASVLLKPAPQAPGAARLLAEIFELAVGKVSNSKDSVPTAVFQVFNASNDLVGTAVSDLRMKVLSFTGSDEVGLRLQQIAVGKRVILELGGNAAVIVHSDADLKRASERCAFGAFVFAGQVCISVQRIFVQSAIKEEFLELFLAEISRLQVGDPNNESVTVGPMIDAKSVNRVLSWIEEAKLEGARVLCGGRADGNVLVPTVLENVASTSKLDRCEVFGPTVNLYTYESFDEAVAAVNDSSFGLQAGVFTESLENVNYAIESLDVGGVLINEAPIFRSDNLPYGGVKKSGIGREGVKFAMREYCEFKTVITHRSR